MTPETIVKIYGCPASRAAKWATPLTDAMERFEIDTAARQAAFLAQIGHESGRLLYVRELWGPTPAQERYEGRADLGNTQPGDGYRFRGRGLLQITGRANYAACSVGLFGCESKLLIEPALLEQTGYAALSAAWWWAGHGLNVHADLGDFERITRIVNGGLNGQVDRVAIYERAGKALA